MVSKPEASLLNKSSRLAESLGVTEFITVIVINLATLLCYLSPTLLFNKPPQFVRSKLELRCIFQCDTINDIKRIVLNLATLLCYLSLT
jgi:hypothetical protein